MHTSAKHAAAVLKDRLSAGNLCLPRARGRVKRAAAASVQVNASRAAALKGQPRDSAVLPNTRLYQVCRGNEFAQMHKHSTRTCTQPAHLNCPSSASCLNVRRAAAAMSARCAAAPPRKYAAPATNGSTDPNTRAVSVPYTTSDRGMPDTA